MIRNYDENAFVNSSGIALLFNLIFSVNTTLAIEFEFHHIISAILVMEINLRLTY